MQKKKGISLIVLVITIIVMIVLAGAIILSLNNAGIIQKANQAVKDTDEATVKELAQMAWAEAYASGRRDVKELQAWVDEALVKNGVDTNEYVVTATLQGVNIALKSNTWIQEGFTVVKGDQVLKIGDVVNYKSGVAGYNDENGWKVLGADTNGNLLIMSAVDVKTGHRLGYDSTDTTTKTKMEECQNDWKNGVTELNTICEAYGNGKGVVGKARSITVEDVDAVMGYDPKDTNSTDEIKTPYGSGQLYEYGNKVTYSYNATEGSTAPTYSATNGKTGTLSNAHSGGVFYYNDKSITNLATGERGKPFVTLTSNYYYYAAPESTAENSKALELIFGEYDEDMEEYSNYYWLASPYVNAYTGYATFGMRNVLCGSVSNYDLFGSNGNTDYGTRGVRAVVTLSSDIQFTGSSETSWSY